jgi:CheY-like chemotaxis protein
VSARRVLSVVPDLFFATRIATVAQSLGVELVAGEPATAAARAAETRPDLIVVDLHAAGDPVAAIRAIRADPATRALRIVGFHSHVNEAIRDAALAAGADLVLPRSQFTVRLAALLAGA